MRTFRLLALASLGLVACDTKVTVPPGETKTTIINPPGDKKETVIVRPPGDPPTEKKTITTTTVRPSGTVIERKTETTK